MERDFQTGADGVIAACPECLHLMAAGLGRLEFLLKETN